MPPRARPSWLIDAVTHGAGSAGSVPVGADDPDIHPDFSQQRSLAGMVALRLL